MIALMTKRLTLPAHLCFGCPVAGPVTGCRNLVRAVLLG